MKYRLLALDIDGTLLGPDQQVPAAVRAAVAEADEAGLAVCLATGRSFAEAIGVWRQLRLRPPRMPLILVGGALVAEPDIGRTLYQKTVSRALACEFADALAEAGHSALAFVDPWRWGVEYYVAEGADAGVVEARWFSKADARARRVRRLADVEDLPCPLRIHAIAPPGEATALAESLRRRFAGRLNVHSILVPTYDETIVEAFAAGADKWTALRYVAQSRRIGPGAIVAVGDDVNDLPAVRNAGLGVAVAHAAPAVRAEADHVVDGSLEAFIRLLLSGGFDGCGKPARRPQEQAPESPPQDGKT